MPRSTAATIDEYIADFPPETRTALEEMRALISASAPGATETISYAIPTFDLNGRHLVHFAGYAKHVGFYPIPSAMTAFAEELAPYKSGKGLGAVPARPAAAGGPHPAHRRVQGRREPEEDVRVAGRRHDQAAARPGGWITPSWIIVRRSRVESAPGDSATDRSCR